MTTRNTATEDLLDAENRARAERLKQKVSQLKSLAIDIDTETKEHNSLLDDVDTDFDSVYGFIQGGRNRVNRLLMSSRSNRRLLCYVALALSVFLIFTYYLITRSLSSKS